MNSYRTGWNAFVGKLHKANSYHDIELAFCKNTQTQLYITLINTGFKLIDDIETKLLIKSLKMKKINSTCNSKILYM